MKECVKINIASPKKILGWTERSLPNGELIGEIKKPVRLKNIINFTNKSLSSYEKS